MALDCVTHAANACCRVAGNAPVVPDHPDARPDLVVQVCRVCGCRHFTLTADPGQLGLRGASIGG